MVAVDEHGQAVRIAEWIPEDEADCIEHQTARKLMEIRKKIGEEMQVFVE